MELLRAIKRPFTNVRKLLVGMALSMVPIVNFFAIGYMVRAARTVVGRRPKYDLPNWVGWKRLFIDGFFAVVALLVYSLPLSAATLVMENFNVEDFTQVTGLPVPWIVALVVLMVFGLLLSYIMPAALVNFSVVGKFRSLFSLGVMVQKAFTAKYLVAWFVAMLYAGILVSILTFGFGYIPYVGENIGSGIASFITGVTTLTLIAEAF